MRRRCGQITVAVILVLPVLIGAMSLSCDVLVLYLNWARLQNAADHAALAGADYLPQRPDLAVYNANTYAKNNGIAAGEISLVSISGDKKTVIVQLRRVVPYTFIGWLLPGTVSAQATARIQTVGSVVGITPVGIDYRVSYTYGQVVQLVQGVGPGNWQLLALGATGASNMVQNIEDGYAGKISLSEEVTTEPGQKVGPVKGAFDYLLNQGLSFDAGGTFSNHAPADPRVLIVPMVDFSSINGASQVPVRGFAALWLVGVTSGGTLSAYFINQVAPGATPKPGAQNYGAYKAVLIQ